VGAFKPSARVIGVESSDGPAMKESLQAGRVVTMHDVDTIIDGLRVRRVGETTFSIVHDLVEDVVTVSDADIFESMLWVMAHAKVVVEGAAAASVAALRAGLVDAEPGAHVACVLSGGNLDLEQLKGLRWN
jgi:threonine dehydratase